MAKSSKAAPPAMPPLPPSAHHEAPEPTIVQVETPAANPAPLVDVGGVQMEAHPVGTAQYIAELESENADALAMKAAVAARATEGFKQMAGQAMTHAVTMAGHLPQDINLIPGTDAINAAAPQ